MTTRRKQFLSVCCAIAVSVLGAGDARAAVTTTGQVNPADPASWSSTDVYVGRTENGSVSLDAGSSVSSIGFYIGSESGVVGEAALSGTGTKWNSYLQIRVGVYGSGTLTIHDGAAVYSRSSTYLGSFGGSNGQVTVSGQGSVFSNVLDLYVGYAGVGRLLIEDGGKVSNNRGSLGSIGTGTVETGSDACNGVAFVSGLGSTWSSGLLLVGESANGMLDVVDGGFVESNRGEIGDREGSSGIVTLGGEGSRWSSQYALVIGGSGLGAIHIQEGGLADVGSNEVAGLVVLGESGGSGVVDLDVGGTLKLHNGDIAQGTGAATFNFNGGRLEGVGTYQVGAGLTQNGGVLAPGNSAGVTTIVGSYVLNSGALEIELLSGSGVAGTSFDRLVVNSGVTLGVSSQLNLLLGYAANVGDSFLIVDIKNSAPINGTFANDDALTAEFESLRYSFSLSYAAGTGNDIAVTVASVALIGDYNADGFVDAADYTVWQDAAGTSVAAYAGADGNGDGVVDDGDHAVWAAHYGASLEAAMVQAVPEPAGVVLTVLALVAGGRRRVGSGRVDSAS